MRKIILLLGVLRLNNKYDTSKNRWRTLGAIVVASAISLTSMYMEKNYSLIERTQLAYYHSIGIQQNKDFYDQSLNLRKEIDVGKNGLEFYLENNHVKLPILKGEHGLQIGSSSYVLKNLHPSDIENFVLKNQNLLSDNAKLKITQSYISQVVNNFSSQIKNYVHNLFDQLIKSYQANHKINP
jgi:hypothetical protein